MRKQLQASSRQDVEVSCYSFGAPRTGNHAFAKDYNKMVPDTWSIINDQASIACRLQITAGLPSAEWQRPGLSGRKVQICFSDTQSSVCAITQSWECLITHKAVCVYSRKLRVSSHSKQCVPNHSKQCVSHHLKQCVSSHSKMRACNHSQSSVCLSTHKAMCVASLKAVCRIQSLKPQP